jgi:hypothetical protein
VYPYGSDDPLKVNIFVMEGFESENAKLPTEKLPQKRYVRVIATGMRHMESMMNTLITAFQTENQKNISHFQKKSKRPRLNRTMNM